MGKKEEQIPPPLVPFRYPPGIYLLGTFIVILLIIAIFILPDYVSAEKTRSHAEKALKNKEYKEALALYEELLKKYPNYREARLHAAIACFGIHTDDSNTKAFRFLKKINLGASEWKKLTKVMPEEYKEYFDTKVG